MQRGLLALEVLGLRLRALERAVQSVQCGIDDCLRALRAGRAGDVVARIELLVLLREALEGVGKALLFGNKSAQIGDQV